MTCIYHVNKINLERITVALTCCKSYIPRAPLCQFTRNAASRHDGKMSPLLCTAICLKNVKIVPSCPPLWSSSLFRLTSEHVADNNTRQEICHQASKSALTDCASDGLIIWCVLMSCSVLCSYEPLIRHSDRFQKPFFLLEQYSRYKGLLQSNTPIRTERVLRQTICAPQEK